jgi:hypothetical protein
MMRSCTKSESESRFDADSQQTDRAIARQPSKRFRSEIQGEIGALRTAENRWKSRSKWEGDAFGFAIRIFTPILVVGRCGRRPVLHRFRSIDALATASDGLREMGLVSSLGHTAFTSLSFTPFKFIWGTPRCATAFERSS